MNASQAELSGRDRRLGLIAVFVGFVLFGSSPALVAGSSLGGMAAAFWRAWIACAVFGALALARRSVGWSLVIPTAAPGLSFGLATGLFFEAAQRTSVANASLIAAMSPLVMVVAARFLFGEHVGVPDIGWLTIAMSGAVFMILAADTAGTADVTGDLIAIVSVLFSSAYFILGRRARSTIDTLPFMAGVMFWAGVALTPIALLAGQDMVTGDGSEWIRLLTIALIPGLGHLLINYSHRSVPLVVIGLAQLLMPVSAAALAWWFLDQTITAMQALGMAVVVMALAAHTLYRSRLPTTDP
ncbi:MAG: DMT family transporter [Acidimicrobiales bacterium]